MDATSENDSEPSITQCQTRTPAIIEEVVDVGHGGKRKKVAEVWSHAKKIVRRNLKHEVVSVVGVCNYCGMEVSAHPKTHGNNGILGHVKKCKLNPQNTAVLFGPSQPILTESPGNNGGTVGHVKCELNPHNAVVKAGTSQPVLTQSHRDNDIVGYVKKCILNPHNAVVKAESSHPILSATSYVLTPHIFNQKKLEEKVVEFIIIDKMPFKVVEGAAFIEMMKVAQPQFKIPNRKRIASLIWDLYTREAAKIKSVIGDQRVSITIDTWTSIQNIDYMVIKAHFLDNDWKLHKRIINFTRITSHKGEHIGKVLEACLSDWGIDKVFTITVNNASTNDEAVEYMGKRLKEMGTLLFDGKYLHLGCCCHILNLFVKSGLKSLDQSIESIRNCVEYIHSSEARLEQFREYAILLKMDKMSIVPMDEPTRWNTTYTMLSAAYKFKKVFGRMEENVHFLEYFEVVVGPEKKKRVGPPNENDWEKSQVFVNFLKRFYYLTLRLSGGKTLTSTLIWLDIVSVRMLIDETMRDIRDPMLQEIAKKMDSKFKKYWGDFDRVNKLVFLRSILDPRFKLQMVEINLRSMNWNSTRVMSFIEGLKNCLLELYHAYGGKSSLEGDDDVVKELMECYKDDPITLECYLKIVQFRKTENQAEIANEVDKYLLDPFEKLSLRFDVLEWWKGNTATYPILSKIAKDVFAIPSSTVATENAFSLGKRVVDPFRASLHPKMMEALVCTTDWLRKEEFNLYNEPTEDDFDFYKECEEMFTSTIVCSTD